MKTYKVGTCGHYGENYEFFDGQTIKTRTITDEIIRHYGNSEVSIMDTYGGIKKIGIHVWNIVGLIQKCKNIVIFPAQNSLKVFVPMLVMLNPIYRRKLHYVVVGGWLPEFVAEKKFLLACLNRFQYIYVETESMKEKLNELGLNNVLILRNCKKINIIEEKELRHSKADSLKLCTFSRVMKEKGIEEAVNAVKYINEKNKNKECVLDIYGQIDSQQCEWFEALQKKFPQFVRYRGIIPYDESTEVLKEYDALIFATYYEGEGFAGTLIDAMAAGVPVIASDWRYNAEIVQDGKTGLIIHKNETIEKKIIWIMENVEQWNDMKKNSLKEADKYLPENVLEDFFVCLE